MPPESEDDALRCAFCYKVLTTLTISQREAHYEHHFLNDTADDVGGTSTKSAMAASSSNTSTHPSSSNVEDSKSKSSPLKFPKETDTFWYPEQTVHPPSCFTPGLIPLIRKGLLKGHSRQLVRRAVLCYEKTIHTHREMWDAHWGCGYRNFLILCAALMSQGRQPLYFPLLDAPSPPSIRNLQSWIESAWKEGFDPDGQKELKKLTGTRKWIGTAELWVAFTYRGIPVELVDFDLRKNPKGSEVVIDWIVEYFSPTEIFRDAFESIKASPVMTTDKMPLILQHDGHSRTIVGYEIDKNGVTSLLTFDPSFQPAAELRAEALREFASLESTVYRETSSASHMKRKRSEDGKQPRAYINNELNKGSTEIKQMDLYAMTRKFRLDPKRLSKQKCYQILHFPLTAPLTDYEKNGRKEVRSTQIL